MKICIDCNHAEMVQIGHGEKVLACTHAECRDPISGVPLPLTTARTNDAFCGVKGRYFKLKEIIAQPDKTIIQLNK